MVVGVSYRSRFRPAKRMVQFALDKSSKVPFHDQIKHQFAAALHMGGLKSHSQLPTIREMAHTLAVNPKTILKIYHRLQDEGLIEIRAGSGVRVSGAVRKNFDQNYFISLVSMAQRHIEEARRLQVSPENYLKLLEDLLHGKDRRQSICLVVECNTEQIRLFAAEIGSRLGITAHPVMIGDLLKPTRRTASLLQEADFLVTTDFHWDQVERLAHQYQKVPLKIRLTPEFLQTLIQCARKGGILMIVSNLDFFANFRSALRDLGYHSILSHIHAVLASDDRRRATLQRRVKYVYLSPLCDPSILKRLPPDLEVVRFSKHVSSESLDFLRMAMHIQRLQKILSPHSTPSSSGSSRTTH